MRREQAARRARESLASFTEYLNVGFSPARHHLFLIAGLERVARGQCKRLMIFMPPGSAKSSYASILAPAWFMGRTPTMNIIAGSHTAMLAERFGRRARNLVGSEEFGDVFPTVHLAGDSQAAARWATSAGGEYLAAGAGAAIVGFRADLGILDDPIAGRKQADSELERENLWQWYLNDFWTRLKPNAAVVLIMQRWHEDDLAGRLLEAAKTGGEQWEVISLPMEAEENDQLGRAPGEPLWPEWFTPEQREQARRDARTWSALYQQRPRPDTGGEFKRQHLRHYRTRPTSGMNTVIVVDPAGKKRQDSDRTGMWLLGLGADRNVYALDIARRRMSLTERADQVFKWHREMTRAGMRPLAVGYEEYGLQADIEHIKDRQERENYRFHVTPLGGSLRKEDRIRRLIPWFEQGRIWLPESLHRTDEIGITRDVVDDFIEQEYLPFPVSKWFDAMDALARLEDLNAMGLLTWPEDGPPPTEDDHPVVSSWMSV